MARLPESRHDLVRALIKDQSNIKTHPLYFALNKHNQWAAERTASALSKAEKKSLIDVAKIQRVLDFGAGRGGSTLSLVHFFQIAVVEAVEEISKRGQQIIDTGVLPAERVHIANGLPLLKRYPNTYDLITACHLGPDVNGELFHNLAKASASALRNNGGHLLIYSDSDTISAMLSVCDETGMIPLRVRREGLGIDPASKTYIFPKSELLKLYHS